jgi:hypothetical protein
LLEFADPQISDFDASKGFSARLAELDISLEHLGYWRSNLRLMRWLMQSPATDTVWRFVLKNAYRPALLAHRKFAFVVGNPPWLSYRYIKRQDYQERVRELVLSRYKLLSSSDAHLFTQMELATLFFAFCAEHYLADGGALAFVMPRSILTGAKQHAEFRQRFVATANLLIDCEKVTPLFNVPACVVLWGKVQEARDTKQTVPMLRLSGELPTRNASWQQAQKILHLAETTFTPPTALGQSPYFEHILNGATIYPRCLWFVRPVQALVIDRRRPQLETDPQIEPQAKAPWKGIRLQGSVEAEFLFATLLSDDMLPFGWRQRSLVVLPLSGRKLLSADDAIRQGKAGLARWLEKADAIWRKHRKSQEELLNYLNWQGKLTAQSPTGVYKLVYKSRGTHLYACVVDTRDVSGWQVYGLPVQGFIVDHACYWLETNSEDEAHYLCAVLNAPCVDDAIKPFQTKGLLGERNIHRAPFEVLPIPLFSRRDERHQRLAELSRVCHEKVAQFVAGADEKTLTQPIGRLRQQVREMLANELSHINRLVTELLGLPR